MPLLVAEQNAVPGATNKIIARFAKVSAISFDAVELPNPVVTGNPLRSEILRFIETDSRNETRRELGVGDRKVITAFGGSLGARHLNETIFELSQNWKGEAISIYHIVGSRDWQDFSQLDRKPVRNVEYEMIEYLKDLTPLIGAADLVISRAGATSVSEITALGIPSILVPLPNSPGGHQEENARFFEREGSAIVVRDSELNYVSLSNRISLLLTEDLILKDMAKKAKNSRHLTGGEKIADLIFEIINGGFDGK